MYLPFSPTLTLGSSAQSKAPSAISTARLPQAQSAAFSAATSASFVPFSGSLSQHALLALQCFRDSLVSAVLTSQVCSVSPAAITAAFSTPTLKVLLLSWVSDSPLSPTNAVSEETSAGTSATGIKLLGAF
ncbi:hypothetical protein XELAEV_18043686mg [Xenopus laevis]|uniref:Uncharacterized protein n=1 Tax=Xenopus laevis TaxID=8355 RepID=A0A974BXE9_XENLA|nr:hypothetical protein XELAEV_18043686mg [Xenopus laevis]